MTKYTAKTFPIKDVSQVILQAVRELGNTTNEHGLVQEIFLKPGVIL